MLAPRSIATARRSTALIVHPAHLHTLPVEPVRLSFWEAVDDAVLTEIASRLDDARALGRLCAVSRRCCSIAQREELWRELCMSRFNCPPSAAVQSWRQLYKFNHEALQFLFAQSAAEALMKQLGVRRNAARMVISMPMQLAV